jgi:hypothetical protein
MVPRNIFAVIICATLLAWGGRSYAADYRPDDFLNLDLSKAVLSPKRLGPTTEFAPFPIEADTDPGQPAAQARTVPQAAPAAAAHKIRAAHVRVEKRRGATRTRLAHRHGNPLDAEAFDRRIQVWPCKSGGICNWQRR